jgi:hypothetical protein
MHNKCSLCSGDWFPTKQTHLGAVCSDCRVLCAECGDWLSGEPEVTSSNGKRFHAVCFLDALEVAA